VSPRWNPERRAWVFVARSVRTPAMCTEMRYRRRKALVALYGEHCWLCNKAIVGEEPTIDHVVPRALGGTHQLSNLRLAHDRCNRRRGHGPIPVLQLTKAMQL
jgi:5-methylcytosine-specific restriction endonuclease McrA